MKTHHDVLPGAIRGAAVFLSYGLVERVIVSVIPRLREAGQDFVPENWWFVVTLFVSYALFGALIGAAAARLFRGDAERTASTAVKSVIVALIIDDVVANVILPSPVHSTLYWAAVVLQTGIAAVLIALQSRSRSSVLQASGSAITISLILLLPWQAVVQYANASRSTKALAAVIAVIVALAGGSLLSLAVVKMAPFFNSTRMLLVTAGTMALVLACAPLWRLAPPRSEFPRRKTSSVLRPNVVLLSLDTVRADHMALYGYPRSNTPEFRKFAQEATLFTNAYSSGDRTLETHASIFTGCDIGVHGAHPSPQALTGRPLPESFPLLPGILKHAGYTPVGIVANSGYLSEHFGFSRGFDYWDSRVRFRYLLPHQRIYQVERFTVGSLVHDVLCVFSGPAEYDALTRTASEINHEVISIVPRVEPLAPFLLFVNYTDVHFPYLPPAPFNSLYPGRDPKFDMTSFERIERRRAVLPAERAHLISQYDGAIAYLDSEVGRLLAYLKRRGLYDEALIIVVSDHGEALGERGQVSHGLSVEDDQIVVPLIVKFPKQRSAQVIDTPVNSVDLLPTILAACGLKIPSGLPGRNLAGPIEARDVLAEHYGADGWIQRALISGPFKLVVDASTTRLVNLRSSTNSDSYLAVEMKRRLDSRVAENARRATRDGNAEERLNILRALGYLR